MGNSLSIKPSYNKEIKKTLPELSPSSIDGFQVYIHLIMVVHSFTVREAQLFELISVFWKLASSVNQDSYNMNL